MIDMAARILREAEWASEGYCPICGGHKPEYFDVINDPSLNLGSRGHRKGCELKFFLYQYDRLVEVL